MSESIQIYTSRINQVIDYVNDNLEKSFSLEELASVAYFSPFHFHRIFMAVTSESVNNFTNRLRLEKAARLLKYAGNSITDIAVQCGFSSSSTFSRAFKHYFEVSPSAYRKHGNIENSKICKELYPVSAYHCPIPLEELEANYPIEIREFPERRVAYIRVLDSYREGVVLAAFKELSGWAKEMNIFQTQKMFGMSVDDPMVTPKEKYRYEVCITIPADMKIEPNHKIATTTMPSCLYAVATVSGDFNLVATLTGYLFNHWLINSSFEPAHQPGMEIFMDNEKACDWSYFDLELCIPVKKMKSY